MIKVLFVCLGNICRSPMAEFILKDMLEKQGLTGKFVVESAATSTEEIWNGVGNPIYPPAQAELKRNGIGKTAYTDFSGKRARQVTREDYGKYDYILCMEDTNVFNTKRITGGDPEGKIVKLMSFTGSNKNVADPWYTGDFGATYRDVTEGCKAFLEHTAIEGCP